ncbi:MAG: hypothetical protein KTR31_37390 [Myxococcales bacterium]|nr:hypothetical protein [Myxococcales bacterium]
MWSLLALAAAHAQDAPAERFNGQVLRPSADSADFLWSDSSATAPNGYASARAYVHYANGLVRWRGDAPTVSRYVSDVLQLDLLGSWHWRGLRLSTHVPIYGVAAGDGANTQTGLGDVAFDLKATVFDGARDPIGAALMARLLLPTASVDVPLGAAGTGWEVIAVVDRTFEPITLAANVGIRDVPRAVLDDLVWNDQIFARGGVAYAFSEDVGASVEVAAQTNWASNINPAGTAVELLLGGHGKLTDTLSLRGGLSAGLSRSPGAPLARFLAGVSWEPDPSPDRDLDGMTDRDDGCPDEAEDPDGYEDWDGCPDPAFTAQIDVVGPSGEALEALVVMDGADSHRLDAGDSVVSLHPGRYRVVAQVDGYLPWAGEIDVPAEQGQKIRIPLEPRRGDLRVWAVDVNGARVNAWVQIDDASPMPANGDPIEVQVGEHALVVTADGYKAAAASVDITTGQQRSLSVVLEALPSDVSDPRP